MSGEYDGLKDMAPATYRFIVGNDGKPAFKTINIKMKTAEEEEKTYTASIPIENYNKIKFIIENPAITNDTKIAALEWAKMPGVKLTRNPFEDYTKIMNSVAPEKDKLQENITSLLSKIKEKQDLSGKVRSLHPDNWEIGSIALSIFHFVGIGACVGGPCGAAAGELLQAGR